MKYLNNIFSSRFHIYEIVFIVAIFAALKLQLFYFSSLNVYPVLACIAIVLCLLTSGVEYPDKEDAITRLTQAISLVTGFYLLLVYQGYEIADSKLILNPYSLKWAAIGFSILALWRPGFLLFPVLQVLWIKQCDEIITRIHLSGTDYLPLIELGVFLWLSFLVIPLIMKIKGRITDSTVQGRFSSYDVAAVIAVAIHFGNYFHSAVAKLMLEGGAMKWLMENKTHYLMLTSLKTGHLPIATTENIWWLIFNFFDNYYIYGNLIILLAQLVSILAITNIRWAILLTIFYDITHVLIYVLTGIFFWKWILLNLGIVYALAALRNSGQPPILKLMGPALVMFGILIFFTARLGWYDSKMLKDVYIVAETVDGETYRVPTNYYLNTSVTFAQSRVLRQVDGHLYESNALGSLYTYWLMKKYNDCEPLLIGYEDVPPKLDNLKEYLRGHHRYVMQNADGKGHIDYDLYPHHIWSNPLLYREFKAIDKRKISSYKIVVDSLCLRADKSEKTISQKIYRRDEYNVEL